MRGQLCSTGAGRCTVALWSPAGMLLPSLVGRSPGEIAITPDGKTGYVTTLGLGTVTPIRTATNTALPPIKTGLSVFAIVITP
jgi:DNA-binding beta-propeller fold protein YncE